MLYFIDLPKREVIKKFTPRIPNTMMEDENNCIERICLSNSISGCITSAPWGNRHIEDFPDKAVFRVYEFSEDDIEEGNLIRPEKLYENDMVRDADITNEHWVINQTLKPKRIFYVEIKNYMLEVKDIIPFKYLNEEDIEDYIDGSIIYVDVEYEEVLDANVLIGEKFELNVSKLIKEFDIKNIENEAIFLIDNYINFQNEVKVCKIINNKLIVEFSLKDGLNHKDFLNKLYENLKRDK